MWHWRDLQPEGDGGRSEVEWKALLRTLLLITVMPGAAEGPAGPGPRRQSTGLSQPQRLQFFSLLLSRSRREPDLRSPASVLPGRAQTPRPFGLSGSHSGCSQRWEMGQERAGKCHMTGQ